MNVWTTIIDATDDVMAFVLALKSWRLGMLVALVTFVAASFLRAMFRFVRSVVAGRVMRAFWPVPWIRQSRDRLSTAYRTRSGGWWLLRSLVQKTSSWYGLLKSGCNNHKMGSVSALGVMAFIAGGALQISPNLVWAMSGAIVGTLPSNIPSILYKRIQHQDGPLGDTARRIVAWRTYWFADWPYVMTCETCGRSYPKRKWSATGGCDYCQRGTSAALEYECTLHSGFGDKSPHYPRIGALLWRWGVRPRVKKKRQLCRDEILRQLLLLGIVEDHPVDIFKRLTLALVFDDGRGRLPYPWMKNGRSGFLVARIVREHMVQIENGVYCGRTMRGGKVFVLPRIHFNREDRFNGNKELLRFEVWTESDPQRHQLPDDDAFRLLATIGEEEGGWHRYPADKGDSEPLGLDGGPAGEEMSSSRKCK